MIDVIEASVMKEINDLKISCGDIRNDVSTLLQQSAEQMNTIVKSVSQVLKNVESEKSELMTKYFKEMERRRQLLDMVHLLKGNIRVMCRIRPLIKSEIASYSPIAIAKSSDETVKVDPNLVGSVAKNVFEFDQVFGETSTQEEVFAEVRPMIESVMDGYHSCIFAYGQTGSGKTFTMTGTPKDHGINIRALTELFALRKQRSGKSSDGSIVNYTFKVSNVEIYNEKVRDLLRSEGDDGYLEIRTSLEHGSHLPGCVEKQVESIEQVFEAIELGTRNRSIAHTKMNIESSRSHSILFVSVVGEKQTAMTSTTKATAINSNNQKSLHAGNRNGQMQSAEKTKTFGRLVLVDLAGSERISKSGVTGSQQVEAQHINKSLSHLGDVMAALASKAPHIPFRNSKLTYLLQDSLSNNNKVLMMVQVSPILSNVSESLCSLQFATRVKQVQLGAAKKHSSTSITEVSAQSSKSFTKGSQITNQGFYQNDNYNSNSQEEDTKLINELENEIVRLKKDLKDARDGAAASKINLQKSVMGNTDVEMVKQENEMLLKKLAEKEEEIAGLKEEIKVAESVAAAALDGTIPLLTGSAIKPNKSESAQQIQTKSSLSYAAAVSTPSAIRMPRTPVLAKTPNQSKSISFAPSTLRTEPALFSSRKSVIELQGSIHGGTPVASNPYKENISQNEVYRPSKLFQRDSTISKSIETIDELQEEKQERTHHQSSHFVPQRLMRRASFSGPVNTFGSKQIPNRTFGTSLNRNSQFQSNIVSGFGRDQGMAMKSYSTATVTSGAKRLTVIKR